VRRTDRALHLRYALAGDPCALILPPPAAPERADELWRSTCFELFIRHGDGAYWEFNFSPSGQWAAYSFTGYREGMRNLMIPPPAIRRRVRRRELVMAVTVPLSPEIGAAHLNLTAVIEEKSGTKSYWALAHPPEGPPDFHHPDCFVLELPPPSRA
jgi:hypothetical protein